jgi:cytoskeletal protein RodZ
MAKSFWSKRTNSMATASAVSRPMSLVLMVVGILIVGGLLFGVFQGARWAFNQLAGNDTVATNPSTQVEINSPSTNTSTPSVPATNTPITATSSTSTTKPSTPAATSKPVAVPATNTQALPQTGPASNTAIFLAVLLISYIAFRKISLKNQ